MEATSGQSFGSDDRHRRERRSDLALQTRSPAGCRRLSRREFANGISSGTFEAQSGQWAGSHILFGAKARLSTGNPFAAANSENASPRTRSAPTTTGSAPQAFASLYVPRTAEPALITSFTIAILLPRILSRSTPGIRYVTGNSLSRLPSSKRSEYENATSI